MICSSLLMWGLLALFLLTCPAVFQRGANPGFIQGVTEDAGGASALGATVTIADVAANARLTIQTNGAGE
jgi:hypothetical protein